jgi:hypothetical protein
MIFDYLRTKIIRTGMGGNYGVGREMDAEVLDCR